MRDININDEPPYCRPYTPEARRTLDKKEPLEKRLQTVLEKAIPDVEATAKGFFARRSEHRAAVERVRFTATRVSQVKQQNRGARLQHRGLPYHDLQECQCDLTNI